MILSRFLFILEVVLLLSMTKYANGDCNSMSDAKGISSICSSLSLIGDDQDVSFLPSGSDVSFNISALIRECVGLTCVTSYQKCNRSCACCVGYNGTDPGFEVTLVKHKNSTFNYKQYLNCLFPTYVASPQGLYGFNCMFNGSEMASATNVVVLQLSWNNMPANATINLDIYIAAGSLSLPHCLWTWERGNKFPLNAYGIFKIILYDAYGNQVSASTGSNVQPNVTIDATFQQPGNDLLFANTTPTIQITWQMAYGCCFITVYAKKEGTFDMFVRDDKNVSLRSMPATFQVTVDESWTGRRFEPPPAPRTYFLGDTYKRSFVGVQMTLNLRLAIFMLVCTLFVVQKS